MAEQEGQVPAGWYPDPLGLPQLRWWDNHAWTEHTSDARQPMVAQETVTAKLAYADDDESNTDLRAELDADTAGGQPDEEAPFAVADPVLSLEAPSAQTRSTEEEPPEVLFIPEKPLEDAPPSSPSLLDTSYDDLLGVPLDPAEAHGISSESAPFAATASVFEGAATATAGTFTATNFDSSMFAAFAATQSPAAASPTLTEQPLSRRSVTAENGLVINTGPVWIIAVMPLIILLLALLFLLAGEAGRDSGLFAGVIVGGSYLGTVVLAAVDRSMLIRLGHSRTASWEWVFLGAPVYLITRMSHVVRETGRGLAPFLTWSALTISLVGAAIAVPGIVMALAPGVFSAEAEQSITEDARLLGADAQVTCPDVPPMLIGETMTCDAIVNSNVSRVEVSLARQNGWIDWRVDDWGIFSTDR